MPYCPPDATMRLYHVFDREERVVYVGVTCQNLCIRMSAHRTEARKHITRYRLVSPFSQWLASELQAGRNPTAKIVKVCGENYLEDERREILKQLRKGQPLLNVVCPDEPYALCGSAVAK